MRWRYKIDSKFHLKTPELRGVSFKNKWLEIDNENITISDQYAWDGCSPTAVVPCPILFPNGIWFGPWDGPLGADAKPSTWKATLIHDALCQFRLIIPNLKKESTIALFRRLLKENNAPSWISSLYPVVVSRFGPQEWNGDK